MKYAVYSSELLARKIKRILDNLGIEAVLMTGAGDEPGLTQVNLVLVDTALEGADAISSRLQKISRVPVVLLIDGCYPNWAKLSETAAHGFLSATVSETQLSSFINAINRRLAPAPQAMAAC